MIPKLQRRLLEQVTQRFPSRAIAVAELSNLLQLGKDAIYRRLRGDTYLSPEEIAQLSLHYHISLDSLLRDQSENILFQYNLFSNPIQSLGDYLLAVEQNLENALGLESPHVYYSSSEITLFHFMYVPKLIAFKLYVWAISSWDIPTIKDKAFDLSMITEEIHQHSRRISTYYNRIPSTELWTLGIVDNSLYQLEYMVATNKLADLNIAHLLYDKLDVLIDHIRKMAELGKKFYPGEQPDEEGGLFDLYHNELLSTNNSVIVDTPDERRLFTRFANPNFLQSEDSALCDYALNWIKGVIQQSNSISGHAPQDRNIYFNRLEKKISASRQRLEFQQNFGN